MRMKELTQGSDRLALLDTFVRIVDTGNLSTAAAQLATTQPTVSRRLQMLERYLGVRLLQRSTHAMTLTADGERFYAHAKNLLDSWQAVESDIRGFNREPQGTLRILAPHAFGQDQLMVPVEDFLRRHSGISIEWILHDRMPDFVAEGIDCAIRVGEIGDTDLVAQRLADVPRIIVAAPDLLAGRPIPEQPGELGQLPWLALQTFYRDSVKLTHAPSGRQADIAIRPRLLTDSMHALHHATLAGLGVGIMSTWVATRDLADGKLVQLAPAWSAAPLPVYLVYPYSRFYPVRLRAFIEQIRAWLPRTPGMAPPADDAPSR